jgi:hypothetical protein
MIGLLLNNIFNIIIYINVISNIINIFRCAFKYNVNFESIENNFGYKRFG